MLTLPVSLFRSESLGFGKPKKVGMPKRSRKAVAVAEDVPVTEDVAGVAAEPPSSPPREAWWDLPPLAPDVVIEQKKEMAKRRSLLAAHDAAAEEFNTIAFSVQYLPSETFLSAIKDAYHTWNHAGAELERFHEEDLGPPDASPACAVNSSAAAPGGGARCAMVVCLLHLQASFVLVWHVHLPGLGCEHRRRVNTRPCRTAPSH